MAALLTVHFTDYKFSLNLWIISASPIAKT